MVLASTNGTVTFQFRGTRAGELSAALVDMGDGARAAAFGMTGISSRPAAAPAPPPADDSSQNLALFVAVPIIGVLIILAIVALVRAQMKKSQESRVNFHDYVQMANQSARQGDSPAPRTNDTLTDPLL